MKRKEDRMDKKKHPPLNRYGRDTRADDRLIREPIPLPVNAMSRSFLRRFSVPRRIEEAASDHGIRGGDGRGCRGLSGTPSTTGDDDNNNQAPVMCMKRERENTM